MKPETAAMLKRLEHEFFESDEFASVRTVLNSAPKNDGELEDLDVVFDRIDRFAPAMHRLIDSFLFPSSSQ